MPISPNEVTACLVTRGDVDMAPILETLVFDKVVIWNNADRADLKTYGRYAATELATTAVVYYQDDDVIVPAETQRALCEMYRPGVMVANYGHGDDPDGYDDLPLVHGGGIVDRHLPLDAIARYLERFPDDEDFRYECDFVAGVLYPAFEHVRLPEVYREEIVRHPSRMCNQPWQREKKLRITNRARRIRDHSSEWMEVAA